MHLKGEGKGEPIPEPEHHIDKPEDLACYPDPNDRPKGFLTPPLFAGKVGRELVAKADKLAPTHPEMWEATANNLRESLKRFVGEPRFAKDIALKLLDFRGKELGLRGDPTIQVEEKLTINGRLNWPDTSDKKVALFRKVVVVALEEPREVPGTIVRAPGKGAAGLAPWSYAGPEISSPKLGRLPAHPTIPRPNTACGSANRC